MNVRSLTLLFAMLVLGPHWRRHRPLPAPFSAARPRRSRRRRSPVQLSVKDAVSAPCSTTSGCCCRKPASPRRTARGGVRSTTCCPTSPGTSTSAGRCINLAVFGLPIEPSIVGPFNVFDARVSLSQPLIDLRALNDYRAAALNEKAEARGISSARDLVVLVR